MSDLVETKKLDGRLPAKPGHFDQYLRSRKTAIGAVASKVVDPERLMKVAVRCVAMTPGLQKCTMDSVFRSILMAAELGLEPGSALGECYLVPYRDVCQFIPGYRGLIALARRSGQVQDIWAYPVYEGDEFTVTLGTDPNIQHVPKFGPRSPDKLLYVYAAARMVGGGVHFDVMTKAEIDAIRKRSAAGSSGPWVTDYVEMAKKTVIRRMCKLLPLSIDMVKAIAADTAAEARDYRDLQSVEFECLTEDDIREMESAAPAPAAEEGNGEALARGSEALKDKLKGNGHSERGAESTEGRPASEKPPLTGAQKHLAETGGLDDAPDLEMGAGSGAVPGAFAR